MRDLNIDGVFWLEETPGDTMAGRLTYTPHDGGQLQLFGSLHDTPDLHKLFAQPIRILGVGDKQLLTLDGCQRSKWSLELPGGYRESFHVRDIFSGAHFSSGSLPLFSSAYIRLENLAAWVGDPGVEVDFGPRDEAYRSDITVTYRPRETSTHDASLGNLKLTFPYSFTSGFKTVIEEDASLGIAFRDPTDIEGIAAFYSAIRNLVTISCYSHAKIKEITLEHPELVRDLTDGRTVHEPIELYPALDGPGSAGSVQPVIRQKMLFTFEDIGGLPGVAKWLQVSSSFRVTIGFLLSHWYLPRLYTETRFLHSVIAAESFQRITLQKQRFALSTALQDMASKTGMFDQLVGDVSDWAQEVVRTRTEKAAHPGLRGEVDGIRMHWLAESLYVLVVLCLLRECGVSDDTFANVQQHERFKSVADGLRRTAPP